MVKWIAACLVIVTTLALPEAGRGRESEVVIRGKIDPASRLESPDQALSLEHLEGFLQGPLEVAHDSPATGAAAADTLC